MKSRNKKNFKKRKKEIKTKMGEIYYTTNSSIMILIRLILAKLTSGKTIWEIFWIQLKNFSESTVNQMDFYGNM